MSVNIHLLKDAAIRTHNFQPVPRDLKAVIKEVDSDKKAQAFLHLFSMPQTKTTNEAMYFVKEELSTPTLHHCLRVYQYGMFIAKDFVPEWNLNKDTWFLACLLHDIGTTQTNQASTLLSFEFQGGIIAHAKTQSWRSSSAQSDGVAEAIIRHQDIDDVGNGSITRLGALLQIATLYDNSGQFAHLIHDTTLYNVVQEYPRLKWSSCFAEVIQFECDTKPWSHTTKIGKQRFLALIKGNKAGNASEHTIDDSLLDKTSFVSMSKV